MEIVTDKAVNPITTLQIGATVTEGGTRGKTVTIGGQYALPFSFIDGSIPNPPAIAVEVWDRPPTEEWPWFAESYKEINSDPIRWINEVEKWSPDLICFRLISCHPDGENRSSDYVQEIITKVLKSTSLPLIILGCGHAEKDSDILLRAAETAKGERCIIGMAVRDNYKTVTAAAMANGHNVIAETPLDINLAKQLNILISDMGLPFDRILMHHTTGGLGYGFEYCYSIMERCRIAGLQGDKVMATPILNMIAQETWKVKEAKASLEEQPTWGDLSTRAPGWELATASAYLQAGSDLVVVGHQNTVNVLRNITTELRNYPKPV